MLHKYNNTLNAAGCAKKPNTSIIFNDKLIYISYNTLIIIDLNTLKSEVKIYLIDSIKLLKLKDNNIIAIDNGGKLFINHKFILDLKTEIICFDILDDFLIASDFESLIFIDLTKKYIIKKQNISNVTSISLIKYNKEILSILGKVDGSIHLLFKDILKYFLAHSDKINSLELNIINSSLEILSSSNDSTAKVHVFNLKSLLLDDNNNELDINLNQVFNHILPVFSAKFVENNGILTASADNSIIYSYVILETNERKELRYGGLHGKNKSFFNSFIFKDKIIGHSNSGGFYSYNLITKKLDMFIGGHQKSIKTLDWLNNELITSSKDGTARIWSNLNRWIETSRPIIHGYYLNGTKFLKHSYKDINTKYKICCYSEEPIIRIYEPTKLSHLLRNKQIEDDMPDYATLSELSLTNECHFNNKESPIELIDLNEKTLTEKTLFNEDRKIYAHYFEVSSLITYINEENTQYLFSANISSHKKYAGIFVHNSEYKKLEYIMCHNSTINELCSSKCGNYLLAVSKDKSSSLYSINKKFKENEPILKLLIHNNESHKREVYNCAFSHNSLLYATCGRDQIINIYTISNKESYSIKCNRTPRSIEFTIELTLLVGYDDGVLEELDLKGNILYTEKLHGNKINDIKFNNDFKYFATGGEDGLLRIFEKN